MTFLDFQLSIFCDNTIKATPENSFNIMSELNKLGRFVYLPSVSQEQNFDITNGSIENVSILNFVTHNQASQIICSTNRIDVIIRYGGDKNREYQSDDPKCCVDLLKILVDKFDITSNRLAINVKMLGKSYRESLDKISFSDGFIIPLKISGGKSIKEWSTRYNVEHKITIGKHEEELNVISELSEVRKPTSDEKAILYHIDLNTVHTNNKLRFDAKCIESFVENAMPIINELRDGFEEMIVDE